MTRLAHCPMCDSGLALRAGGHVLFVRCGRCRGRVRLDCYGPDGEQLRCPHAHPAREGASCDALLAVRRGACLALHCRTCRRSREVCAQVEQEDVEIRA